MALLRLTFNFLKGTEVHLPHSYNSIISAGRSTGNKADILQTQFHYCGKVTLSNMNCKATLRPHATPAKLHFTTRLQLACRNVK